MRDVRCGMRTTDGISPGSRRVAARESPPLHAAAGSADAHPAAQARQPRLHPARALRAPRGDPAGRRRMPRPRGAARRDGRDRRPRAAGAGDDDLRDARRAGGDRDRFTVWTAEATFGLAAAILPPEVIAQARAAGMALAGYFEELIEKRRGDAHGRHPERAHPRRGAGRPLEHARADLAVDRPVDRRIRDDDRIDRQRPPSAHPPPRGARPAQGRPRAHRLRGERVPALRRPDRGHRPHPPRGRRVRRQEDPQGLDGLGDAGVGQPRSRALSEPRCLRHRRARTIIWPSAAAPHFCLGYHLASSRPAPRSARWYAASRICGSSRTPSMGSFAIPRTRRAADHLSPRVTGFGAPDCQARCGAIDPTAHDS